MAAILHQPETKSSTSVEKGLEQSKAPVLPVNVSNEEEKCEDLEMVVVGDDPKKFFLIVFRPPKRQLD